MRVCVCECVTKSSVGGAMLRDRPRWTGNFVDPALAGAPVPEPVPSPEPELEPEPKRPRWEPPPAKHRAGLLSCYGGVRRYMRMLSGELPWPVELSDTAPTHPTPIAAATAITTATHSPDPVAVAPWAPPPIVCPRV